MALKKNQKRKEEENVKSKPYQSLAWFFTVTLILAATMAAFNMYPYYSYAFTFSNLGWENNQNVYHCLI